jgi:hypothetical protein
MTSITFLALFSFYGLVRSHLFMGNPPPFRWSEVTDIGELVMPLNGASGFGQQPFPCKGHHMDINGPSGQPRVTWKAGELVTVQWVFPSSCGTAIDL